MKQLNIYIIPLLVLIFVWSCDTKDIEDIEQEVPVVVWEADIYRANIILEPYAEKIDPVNVRLFGKSIASDVKVSIEVDAATTAIEGTEFTIESKNLVVVAGSNFVEVPFVIDAQKLEADVEKKVVLNITTVSGARNSKTTSTVVLNKINYDVSGWAGDYTFEGDGWTRDASVKATGTPYELVMNSFWGNGLDMAGTVDATDLNNLRFIVPAGTKLDNGWDDKGAWWLATDLIATMDEDGKVMDFIQFDYVCDDGTEGSFPWCSGNCTMTMN
ncbi:hypothetical protein [Carboxylicivirga sp. N1Y90]|uniref:hypothetical protein n=1 Tax=Carboxylicivirga fragile TaxID=3417571 RepID=UPI003D32BD86|nr:hypothetical protein [Marinilabiliaceae bacterium N1Y90]